MVATFHYQVFALSLNVYMHSKQDFETDYFLFVKAFFNLHTICNACGHEIILSFTTPAKILISQVYKAPISEFLIIWDLVVKRAFLLNYYFEIDTNNSLQMAAKLYQNFNSFKSIKRKRMTT